MENLEKWPRECKETQPTTIELLHWNMFIPKGSWFFFRTHQPSSHGKILKPRVTPCWRLFIRVITPLLVGARLANEFPPTKTRLKVNDSLRSIYARHYKNMSSKEHRASWRRELVVELLGAWVMSSWWWSWVYLLEYTHYINTFRPLSSLDIRGW